MVLQEYQLPHLRVTHNFLILYLARLSPLGLVRFFQTQLSTIGTVTRALSLPAFTRLCQVNLYSYPYTGQKVTPGATAFKPLYPVATPIMESESDQLSFGRPLPQNGWPSPQNGRPSPQNGRPSPVFR